VSGPGVAVRIAVIALASAVGAAGAAYVGRALAGAVAGLALGAMGVTAELLAARAPIDRLAWGVAGGITGVVTGTVAGFAVVGVVPFAGPALIAIGALLGGYLGAAVGVRRGPDATGINAALFPRGASGRVVKLVDTSAIIDGRIADLAATGFLEGPLVVPQFVLRELQHVADATDPGRRARGKRGFEVVQRLQRLPGGLTEIQDIDVPGVTDVDRKLVDLAKARGARIVTTDYNLNKLAELSGVTVLNVNELANALKPAVMAGEPMRVSVVREGKESGQGVAYLDDGTMVVVDQGKRWLGQTVDVAVTSVLQTPAGRIIFTRLRDEEPARA
jgi:uncharacterized protein YacL